MKSKVLILLAALVCAASLTFGAALSAERNTPAMIGKQVNVGVYTNTIIYAGGMVAVNSSGYAVEASDATTLTVVGRAAKTVDNRTGAAGAGTSGKLTVDVDIGTFYWDLSTTTTNKALIGNIVYVKDDHTVSADSTSYLIIAGYVQDYNAISGQVAVNTINFAAAGALTPASMAVSGNASVVGTFGVTGATTVKGLTASSITSTGAVSLAAGSVGSAALAYGVPYTTQTVAGVFTNVLDAKGLTVSHNP